LVAEAEASRRATIALLVISHWVLDFATHRPDMPLTPWSPVKLGLGLWNSVAGTLVVESAMFVAGLWLYLSATRASDGIGRNGLAALITLLIVIYLGAAFGPPPPSVPAIALSMLPAIALVFWAAWVDPPPCALPSIARRRLGSVDMADIEFRTATTRSISQVKSALEVEIKSRLPGERIKKFWEGDVFRLVGMGADGRIEVVDGEIRAHATLKPPLSLMKGRVEQGLRETVAAAAGPTPGSSSAAAPAGVAGGPPTSPRGVASPASRPTSSTTCVPRSKASCSTAPRRMTSS
jgi:hypothetical protein